MLVPDPSLELTQRLALSFTRDHYPDEVVYFQLIWDACVARLRARAITQASPKPADLSRLRLPFIGKQRLALTAPQTILTVAAVLYELRDLEIRPSPQQLEQAIRASAIAFGATKKHAEELVSHVGPALLNMLSTSSVTDHPLGQLYHKGLATTSNTSPGSEEGKTPPGFHRERRQGDMWVVHRVEGLLEDLGWCAAAEVEALLREHTYEWVIDERPARFWIEYPDGRRCLLRRRGRRHGRDTKVPAAHHGTRRALFLAMLYADALLDHVEIGDVFGFDKGFQPAQLPFGLRRNFGENAADRVITAMGGGYYRIHMPDFLWIRSDADPKRSRLVKGLVRGVAP